MVDSARQGGVTVVAAISMAVLLNGVSGHGFLLNPVSRNKLANSKGQFYQQMSLNRLGSNQCGGMSATDSSFAAGGVYATKKITGNYTEGGIIHTQTQIWINHWGWLQFRLCPLTNPSTAGEKAQLSEECFAGHVLKQINGSGSRHWINHGIRSSTFVEKASFRLPAGVTCRRCVLQWIWVTSHACKLPGNPSHFMTDGLQGLNPCPANYMSPDVIVPEKFFNCADITIRAAPATNTGTVPPAAFLRHHYMASAPHT